MAILKLSKRRDKRLHLLSLGKKEGTNFINDDSINRDALVDAIISNKNQDENLKRISSYNKKISNDIMEFLMQDDLDAKLAAINEGEESDGEEDNNEYKIDSLPTKFEENSIQKEREKYKGRMSTFVTPNKNSLMNSRPRASMTLKYK